MYIFWFCILLIVDGYNFDDSFYNEILAGNFNMFDEENTITLNERFRRDARNDHKDFKFCCGEPQVNLIANELKATKEACFQEIMNTNAHEKPDHQSLEERVKDIICIEQCVAQQKGLADPTGNLKEDILRNYTITQNTMEWLKPKLDGIITKCLEEGKEGNPAAKNPIKSSSCNAAALNFAHCVFRETQFACPADLIENPDSCDKFLKFLQQPDLYYKSHP